MAESKQKQTLERDSAGAGTQATDSIGDNRVENKSPSASENQKLKFRRDDIYERKASANTLEERTAKFFDVVLNDIGSSFRKLFGGDYISQNDFSFTQKQEILQYLYLKNIEDMEKKSYFTYLNYEKKSTAEEIKKRIEHLNQMRQFNRMQYITELNNSQARIRLVGQLGGAVVSSVIINCFKNASYVRVLAVAGFVIHAGGQIASYRAIDRVFDGLYPIFNEDLQKYLQEEANEENKNIILDSGKEPTIEALLKRSSAMKKARDTESYNQKI